LGVLKTCKICQNLYFGLYLVVVVVVNWTELSQDSVKLWGVALH
jgi:hypothetical protein